MIYDVALSTGVNLRKVEIKENERWRYFVDILDVDRLNCFVAAFKLFFRFKKFEYQSNQNWINFLTG